MIPDLNLNEGLLQAPLSAWQDLWPWVREGSASALLHACDPLADEGASSNPARQLNESIAQESANYYRAQASFSESIILDSAEREIHDELTHFLARSDSRELVGAVFGEVWHQDDLIGSIQSYLNDAKLPALEVLATSAANKAFRASYSTDTDTIYFDRDFLAIASSEELVDVYLEELGHYWQSQAGDFDIAADEGELLTALILEKDLSPATVQQIAQEDDRRWLLLDGQWVAIEQASWLQTDELQIAEPLSGIYYLPKSDLGLSTTLSFQAREKQAKYSNEIGFYLTDSLGRVDGILPGEEGYTEAVLKQPERRMLFNSNATEGSWQEVILNSGVYFGMYLVADGSSEQVLGTLNNNPNRPNVYFSETAANPDGVQHMRWQSLGNGIFTVQWEDLWGGGDNDFNDAVFSLEQKGIRTPGNSGQLVPFNLNKIPSEAAYHNEMGFYYVDDAEGRVNGIAPGDINYAQEAFKAGNYQPVFEQAGSATNRQFTLAGNRYIGLYLIADSNRDAFLRVNPTNKPGNGANAYFSYPRANPTQISNLYNYSGDQWGWEDLLDGGDKDYNDLFFSLDFGTPRDVTVTVNDVFTTESASDPTVAEFTLKLSEAHQNPVTISYETVDQSAVAGLDYLFAAGNVTFAPGVTEQRVAVTVLADGLFEQTEQFGLQLSGVANVQVVDGFALGFIKNIDPEEEEPPPPVNNKPSVRLENAVESLDDNTDTTIRQRVADIIVSDDSVGNNQLSLSGNDAVFFEIEDRNLYLKEGTALDFEVKSEYAVMVRVDDDEVGESPDDSAPYTLSVSTLLKEETNFSSTIQTPIHVSASPSILHIKLEGLSFDETDTNSINDAFELEFVDTSGHSLVHTIGSEKTAFLNITEGLSASLAPGVTFDANTGIIHVNLVGVRPNVTGNLILRLINNDQDTGTQVRIRDIHVENAPAGTIAPVETSATSVLRSFANPSNVTNLMADVTDSMEVQYQRSTLNGDTNLLYADFNLKNIGSYGVNTNLFVAIKNISDPTVQIRDTNGITLEGLPYYDFTDSLINDKLDHNQVTKGRSLVFLNPNQVQFTYDIVVLAVINRNPIILTQPDLEIIGGQAYHYDINAIDPDSDSLTYRLLVAPQGMTIDAVTGLTHWQTAMANIGNQLVMVEVSDGRGGIDLQSYTLSITDELPNRPPTIKSAPIVNGSANGAYLYDVEATDPDLDTLTYELTQSPTNMVIESDTGVIHWLPTASQLGLQDVTVKVYDNKRGIAEQKFQISVQQEAVNNVPTIITDPITKIYPNSHVSEPQLFDLSKWSVIQYEFNNQPDATWHIQSGNTIVEQKVNADASIFLSNTNVTNNRIDGTWRVGTTDDDDYIGFVFGFQDPQHFYLFDWKQADQNDPLGFAERGMSIKVVDADSSLKETDLWPMNGNGQRVQQLFHNTIAWKPLTDYRFTLEFLPDHFTITVKEGINTVESVTIKDNTYSSGNSGFYNYSQPTVLYSGFTQQALPSWNYSYDVNAADADRDILTFSLIDKPSGMTINPDSGLIAWNSTVQASQSSVKVKVEDGRGGFDTQSYVIELADRSVDLTLADIHTESLVVDGQLLTVSGQVSAQIKNQGLNDLTDRFKVIFFEDRNTNQMFDVGDSILGETQVTTPIQAGQTTTVTTNLSGFLSFINSPIWGFVDANRVITETNENNNFAFNSQDCIIQPSGQFNPVIEWNKSSFSVFPNSNLVVMTPAVIDLNKDGIPDIIFSTADGYYNGFTLSNSKLRAISGADGRELWTITDPAYEVNGVAGVTVGDIDNDGKSEILAVTESASSLIAFEHDGTFKWRSPEIWGGINWGSASIADLNQDGTPEIIVGATVLNNQGQIFWQGNSVGGVGRGDNTSLGPLSVVADLDLDGKPEIVAGKSAYRADGSLYWNASTPNDGFPAIGNFDGDPNPEIVVVSNGLVYLLEHTGQVKWGGISIPGGGRGGPPTIADVDGDGQPEIGVAGASRYVVLETDGSVKWTSATQDVSSGVTGSSAFDFNGDGNTEIVYRDERFLRIYNGNNGQTLYQLPMSSGTAYEYPLIIDVDNDGNAEIVVAADNKPGGLQTGIFVIGDLNDTWVSTRQIWNQHSYHITNINDDGSIPIREENSWQSLNTYRLNLQTNYNPLAAPDLTASYLKTEDVNGKTTITTRIGNGGSIFVASGVNVAFYKGDPKAGGMILGTSKTTKELDVGAFEDVSLTISSASIQNIWIVADDDGNGNGQVNECDEENNRYSEVLINGRAEIRGTKWVDSNSDGIRNNLIADSVAEFSGVQGLNNWYYGYYDGPFVSSDFQKMVQLEKDTESYPSHWAVQKGTFWTSMGSYFTHPNGVITSGGRSPVEQWSVRRWVSKVDGEIEILVKLAKLEGQVGGNGVTGRVIIDGVEVWSNSIAGSNTQGIDDKINTTVKLGSIVDFALDPSAANDLVDSTIFTAKITQLEPGLANITVYLDLDNDGLLDPNEPSQITSSDNPNTQQIDETGQYRFANLAPGIYSVREAVPSGYKQSFPTTPVNHIISHVVTRVTGTSDPWLAGMPDEAIASIEDSSPDQSPTLIPGLQLNPGNILTFEVTGGQVGNGPNSSLLSPNADGANSIYNFVIHDAPHVQIDGGAENGISGLYAPINSLIGVFLDSDKPNTSAAPIALDFGNSGNVTGGTNYSSLAPELKQVFFIGDGLNAEGKRNQITVPNGATRLFLGTMDGFGWWNNVGFYDITVTESLSKPQPGSHIVPLVSGQIAEQIDFGNTNTNETKLNQPPVFTSTVPTIAQTGQLFRYAVKANDDDDDRLTYSLSLKPEGMTIDESTGLIAWKPTHAQLGTHDLILRVQDHLGAITLQSARILVQSANHSPLFTSIVPNNIQFKIGKDFQFQSSAIDPDNDALSYVLATNSANGMNIDARTGLVTWNTDDTQIGVHQFTIKVADGNGGESFQTVSFTVSPADFNEAPTFTSTPRTTTRIGSPYYYQVAATDPNGDALTYSLVKAPKGMSLEKGLISWESTAAHVGQQTVTIQASDGILTTEQTYQITVSHQASNRAPIITSAPNLTTNITQIYSYNLTGKDPDGDFFLWVLDQAPLGMVLDQQTGALRWQPQSSQLGHHQVIVRLLDTYGDSSSQAFTLTVNGANSPANILSNPLTRAIVNQVYTYAVVAVDPESSPLIYRLGRRPNGMTIDATGKVQWMPTEPGSYDIDVSVTDNQGAITTQTYRLEVGTAAINQAPTILSTPSSVANVGSSYQYQVEASDPEAQILRYQLLESPQGMSIGAASGLLNWTNPVNGNYQVVVAAFDSEGLSATQGYILKAKTNSLPVIRSTPGLEVSPNQIYRYDIRAVDPDGDSLRYSLDDTSQAMGMSLDAQGRFTWIPTNSQLGDHAISLTVIDGAGGTAHQTFVLKVTADTVAPKVRVNRSSSLINLGSTVSFQVVATDNVSIANLQLLINGIPVVTDSNGVVSFTAITAGVITATAVALDAAGNRAEATTTVDVFDPTDTEAPIVSLDLSGIENGEITGPVEIKGSVKDANLDYYVLEVAPADGSQPFKEMFRGRSLVNNGALGVLDPTLLINDTYQVRLIAYDVNGLGNSVSAALDIQGNLKLGNFQLAFNDIEIPVAGIPITLTRTYDTLASNSKSDFGYGWRMEFRNAQVRTSLPKDELYEELGIRGVGFKEGDSVYVTLPGGKRERFTFRLEAINVLVNSFLRRRGLYKPVFVADKGSTSTLNVDTAGIVLIRGDDNRVVPLSGGSAFSYYNPQDWGNAYRLTTKEGVVYNINATTGDINAITNRNGDVLTFSDGGIVSSNGQQVTFERDAQGRIVAAIDPLGMRVTYQYDAQGDLVKVTDRDKNSTTFEYNDQRPHYLDKVIDPLGQTGIRNEYDQNGRLAKVFNALGNGAQLEYNPENSLYTTKDALGNSTTYEYDLRGNVITEVDAKGGISRRTYDADNNKLSETNPAGATTHYTYDRRGNKLTETDALGNITRYTYNTNGDLLSTANALGNTVINTYDSNGNPTAISGLANGPINLVYGADGLLKSLITAEGTTTYEYDRQGNITKEINPLGHATTYTYDGNGNRLTETRIMATPDGFQTLVTTMQYNSLGDVIKVTDPLGNVTQMSYDPNGHKSQEIDALGRVTKFVYSSVGQLVETIYPDLTPDNDSDNPRIRKEYDAANRLVAEIDELGRRTEFQYDAMGRLTFTLFPDLTPSNASDNPRTESRYDDVGRVIAEVDERGNVTRYEYDALGRRTKTILPDGTADNDSDNPQLIVSYDALGRQLTQVDPLGRTTQFLYDSMGRSIGQIFADQTDILTTYDLAGRVVAKSDQMGHKTHYEYNSVGQLVAVIDALNQRTEYQYNELGNLISQKDALGNITRYEYDGLGRRIATDLPLGQNATMTYDAVGNLLSTTDFNGQTTHFEYDERNRLTSKTFPDNRRTIYTYALTGQRATESSSLGTITFSYDVRDNLLSRVDADGVKIEYSYDVSNNRTAVKIPSGRTSYTFDEQKRLKRVTDPQAGVSSYAYDLAGNLIKATLANGTTETREYDLLNRLLYLQNSNGGGVINSFLYTIDKAGNRLAIVEQDGRQSNFKYDALYRLSREEVIDGKTRAISYAYDAVSNRLARNDSLDGTTAYEYDGNDRLLKEVANGVTTTYTYDSNGNILTKTVGTATTTYQWNVENRLIGADTDGDGINDVTNEYDGDGVRIRQTLAGEETRFLLDKNRDYAQVLEEYTPSNIINASYVYGHDLISQSRDTERSFYHVDGLGSTRALTDVNGLITDSYSYEAFGEITKQLGNTQNSYLFAGEQRDTLLGLDYLRARYLDFNSGRFLSRDGFAGILTLPLSAHKYIYCHDNPVIHTDPSGYYISFFGLNLPVGYSVSTSSAYVSRSMINQLSGKALERFVIAQLERYYGRDAVFTGVRFVGPGGVRIADAVIKLADKLIIVEVKTKIPLSGSSLARLGGQLKTFSLGTPTNTALRGLPQEVLVVSEQSAAAVEASFLAIESQIATGTLSGVIQGTMNLTTVLRGVLLGL